MGNIESTIRVNKLKTFFFSELGVVKAVNDVSFCLPKKKVLALVGESGCGKSVTALSLLRLIPSPPGKIVSGEVWFEDINILALPESELNNFRGNRIGMVFQDPMTALNPVFTIGEQIEEVILKHGKTTKHQAPDYVLELLTQVGITSARRVYESYPHQLSGGMRQRALIAMAISCHPDVLIADEPTTALDVTIQAHILQLLKELQENTGLSVLFITHDFRVVAEIADEVAVMYAGKIIEKGMVNDIFDNPLHPYTKALMNSIPGLSSSVITNKRLKAIPGSVPNLIELPKGCAFSSRCPYKMEKCHNEKPPMFYSANHSALCWLYEKNLPSDGETYEN